MTTKLCAEVAAIPGLSAAVLIVGNKGSYPMVKASAYICQLTTQ